MEKEKKFTNVKLYGEKLNVVIPPSIKGAKHKTKNLLFNKLFKKNLNIIQLNLKFYFQLDSFWSNLYL